MQRTQPCSEPNTFSILSSAGGGRQTDWVNPFPSFSGDRKEVAAWGKSWGPGGYLAQSYCSRQGDPRPPPCRGPPVQPLPHPSFLQPRLGTKDFKFWFKM